MCEDDDLLEEYDFSNAIPNPYFERLSTELTFRLDNTTLAYFKKLADQYGWDAERMISVYLRHIAGISLKFDLDLPTLEEQKRMDEEREHVPAPQP